MIHKKWLHVPKRSVVKVLHLALKLLVVVGDWHSC